MKKAKKLMHVAIAATTMIAPFTVAPKAFAVTELDVDVDDDEVDAEAEYTITFELEEDLEDGDDITITFDDEFDLSDVDEDDDVTAEVDDDDQDDISVDDDDNTITITVDNDYEEGDEIEIKVDNVTNPDDDGDYEIEAETDKEDSDSFDVSIGDGDDDDDDDDDDGDFEVDLSNDEEGEKSSYEFDEIDIDDDDLSLETDEEITITFPDDGMLPDEDDIEDGDLEINGNEIDVDDIDINDDEVIVTVPDELDGDETIEIEFKKSFGIENPDADDDYTITVEYDDEKYESEEFEIVDEDGNSSKADKDFVLTASDSNAGSRSSYTLKTKFGSSYKLEPGKDVTITFPTSEMLPASIAADTVYVNGKASKSVHISGNKVYITAPDNMSKTDSVEVSFGYYSWIKNPKVAGSYTISMSVAGKTVTSKPFAITGTAIEQPTIPSTPITPPVVKPPVVVNNANAKITFSKTALKTPSGFSVDIPTVGEAMVPGRDYFTIALPVGFKVPAKIATTNVSVNNVYPSAVVVQGQNLLIYPKQTIAANTSARIFVTGTANIVTPSVKNVYYIGVNSSAHTGQLFARAVGFGGAVVKAATPAPTPSVVFPLNAARIKIGVANFTLRNNTYPLTAAPSLANNTTTVVPAQFFKEGLALSTIWNNQTVSIVGGTKAVKLTVGSNVARVGAQAYVMPAPVTLQNNMPMIPLKFVADQLGYKVLWDAKTNSVGVFK